MRIFTLCGALVLALTSMPAASADHTEHHQHQHDTTILAPIGVMRDHVHAKGGWMFSYRYEYMFMGENYDGSSAVSDAQVLQNYMVAPTDMLMRMHMVGAMYGLTDTVTLGLMGGYTENRMDHVRRNGTTFIQHSEGLNDTRVNLLYEFYNDGAHRLQWNNGISLPTGTVDEINRTSGNRFAYPMQTGSGTYDLLPGISYSGHNTQWAWGGQVNATLRLGENKHDYALGDRVNLTSWLIKPLGHGFDISTRLNFDAWGDLDGADASLSAPFMAPPMDAGLQAGERLQAFIGASYTVPEGEFAGHRIAGEFGMPIYQRLDGPRLAEDYRFTLGWQKAF